MVMIILYNSDGLLGFFISSLCLLCLICRRQSLPLSGLSNAELADHYADCIKLSTENVGKSNYVQLTVLFRLILVECTIVR